MASSTYGPGFRNATSDRHPYMRPSEEGGAFSGLYRDFQPVIMNSAVRQSATVKLGGVSISLNGALAHLDTSLVVGRRDRAAQILQRLAENCAPTAPELAVAHTAFLEDGLKRLMAYGRDSSQSQIMLREMQRWFEVEMRDKGVPLDANMIVIMMRAVIRALNGPRRDRSIRRYTDLSELLGEDMLHEVLQSEDYDDIEIPILERAAKDYFVESDETDAADVDSVQGAPELPAGRTERGRLDLERTPAVLATEQKGDGLDSIKQVMNIFSVLSPPSANATPEEQIARQKERQEALEGQSVQVAMERWREANEELKAKGINSAVQARPIAAMMWEWQQLLAQALKQELVEVKQEVESPSQKKKESDRHLYCDYLERLSLDHIAGVTILVAMTNMAQGKRQDTRKFEQDVKLSQMCNTISDTIESDWKATVSPKQKGGQRKGARKRAVRTLQSKEDATTTPPKRKSKKQRALEELEWTTESKMKFGAMLLSKLLGVAKLPVIRQDPRSKEEVQQMQAAFVHKMKYQKGKKVGVISPNSALLDKLSTEPVGDLIAKRMPMVYPPQQWAGWKEGGYLKTPTPILRLPHGDKDGRRYFQEADNRGQLDRVYHGLNALSGVPWRIHPGVFKVQLEAWNTGEAIANFAPLKSEIEYPPEPEADTDSENPYARYKWIAEVRDIKNRATGLHSKRCFQNFQLEIARTVVNETLYFPHNLDFRGRAYPIPPYLNHMGADNVRGLLVFADGKELGEEGLRWLKIHLASVAGHDKASSKERWEWTDAHMDDIRDSVRDPLGGRRWWLEADDAWQTLAACFELTQALDSPDPTKFVSHLPIQQDGTCNGLQHYAALGGDSAGAAQVNLVPGERPADVYTAVADAVKAEVEKDAAEGNPVALVLRGRLTRKCVKQPVMTNVYGVTFYGAKEQVRKQLEVLFPEVKPFGEVNLGNMSHYVATKIFKSLGSMFKGAQAIQNWLGQCADRISTCLSTEDIENLMRQQKTAGPRPKKAKKAKAAKPKKARKLKKGEVASVEEEVLLESDGKSQEEVSSDSASLVPDSSRDGPSAKPLFQSLVVWTTPLQLPVVQPYRTSKTKNIATTMQGISIMDPQPTDAVSKRKQLQAFPPNFIHSLDATHMLLSASKCKENGMTFASIHDSFWTHACDVTAMSGHLRDAFIEMHQGDIIERLKREFEVRYTNRMYLAPVIATSKVGEAITARRTELKSDQSIKDSELALEYKRMSLLNSGDPEKVAEGQAMVTPGSIFLTEPDQAAFAIPLELDGSLGQIPGINAKEATSLPSTAENAAEMGAVEAEHLPEALPEAELDEALELSETSSDEIEASTAAEPSKASSSTKASKKLFVWLPLTFPEVPEKGDFKVGDVKNSTYFFH